MSVGRPLPEGVSPLLGDDPRTIGGNPLLLRLGSGGMGTVYLGEDPSGGHVAIKVIRRELALDGPFRARFAGEVANARRVASFCTARVLDHGEDDGRPYMVTEYIDGVSLGDLIEGDGALATPRVRGLAVGTAAALTAIHAVRLVHRDLKPANVLVSDTGPRVIDFGIARALDSDERHTQTGIIIGSPGWIAPEQVFDGNVGTAADVFAWGTLVAYAAAGEHPYGDGNMLVLASRAQQRRHDLSEVPDDLRRLVHAALSPDPAARPSAEDLLLALVGTEDPESAAHRIIASEWAPIPAPPATAPFLAAPPATAAPTTAPPAAAPTVSDAAASDAAAAALPPVLPLTAGAPPLQTAAPGSRPPRPRGAARAGDSPGARAGHRRGAWPWRRVPWTLVVLATAVLVLSAAGVAWLVRGDDRPDTSFVTVPDPCGLPSESTIASLVPDTQGVRDERPTEIFAGGGTTGCVWSLDTRPWYDGQIVRARLSLKVSVLPGSVDEAGTGRRFEQGRHDLSARHGTLSEDPGLRGIGDGAFGFQGPARLEPIDRSLAGAGIVGVRFRNVLIEVDLRSIQARRGADAEPAARTPGRTGGRTGGGPSALRMEPSAFTSAAASARDVARQVVKALSLCTTCQS